MRVGNGQAGEHEAMTLSAINHLGDTLSIIYCRHNCVLTLSMKSWHRCESTYGANCIASKPACQMLRRAPRASLKYNGRKKISVM